MANLLIISEIVIFLGIVFSYIFDRKRNARFPLPPGPKPRPIIGNYKDLPPPGKLHYEHWLKFKDTYGPISSITVLGQPMIILHDKQAILDLLEKSSSKTSNRPNQPFGNQMCGFSDFLPSLQYDTNFRKQRRLFHQQMGTKLLSSRFSDVQDLESRRFLLRVLEDPKGLREHIKTEASAIILKITYGYSVEPHGMDPLVSLVNHMMECIGLVFVPLSWVVDIFPALRYLPKGFPGAGTFQRKAAQCKVITTAVIDAPFEFVRKRMKKGGDRSSFVSSSIQQCSNEDRGLSEDDADCIKLCAAVMYGGGADTTVSTISSMVLAMVLYPDVQSKAQKEIENVIGSCKMPELADRERLPYVTALVKESLRWIPILPVGTTHVVSEEIIYKNYRIPKGAYLLPQIWWCLHDPKVYADPDRFDPERFLSPRKEPDSALEAFGYGRRICPGRFLAEDSLFLTIARILAVFNISKLRDEQGREVEFEVVKTVGLICRPGPFPYRIQPKSQKHAELIRSFEVEHPWEKGDAYLLEGRVQALQVQFKV